MCFSVFATNRLLKCNLIAPNTTGLLKSLRGLGSRSRRLWSRGLGLGFWVEGFAVIGLDTVKVRLGNKLESFVRRKRAALARLRRAI